MENQEENRNIQLLQMKERFQLGRIYRECPFSGVARERPAFSEWTESYQSEFIESLLVNIPVPPLILWEEKPDSFKPYGIVDGRKRLQTMISFLSSSSWSLKSLPLWPHLNNMTYHELPVNLRNYLLKKRISAIVLLPNWDENTEETEALLHATKARWSFSPCHSTLGYDTLEPTSK